MKKENGYFTVEAALIFPLALGTVLFVVYMLLFQYDRCLMEQDLGALAMWGSRVEAESAEEFEKLIQKRLDGIYWEKYAVWKTKDLKVKLERNQFSVTGEGRLTFPIPGFHFWNEDTVWTAEIDFRFYRMSPTDFVRLCNRARGWIGNEN